MNRYILIRRLRGPAFLLLVGFIALLHQMDVVYHMAGGCCWPLFADSLGCAAAGRARARLEVEGLSARAIPAFRGQGARMRRASAAPPAAPPTAAGTSIVPATLDELERIERRTVMSSVPPYTPPGGGAPPPYDPKTQWRVYREQQQAAWRAQRDAWKAQRHAWKAALRLAMPQGSVDRRPHPAGRRLASLRCWL